MTKRLIAKKTSRRSYDGTVAATKDRIVAAAYKCFVRHGIEAATIDDIAAESGIARATIYRYFRRKIEIAHEIALRGVADINAAVRENTRDIDDPVKKLVEAIATSIEFVSSHEYMRRMLVENATMRLIPDVFSDVGTLTRQRLEPLMIAGIRAKAFPENLDIPKAIGWIRMVQNGLIMQGDGDKLNRADLREYLETFVIKGLAAR